MPYDRKTELLWNYIGMAQFSELAKLWGQGAASPNTDWVDETVPQTVTISSASTSQAVTVSAFIDGGDISFEETNGEETGKSDVFAVPLAANGSELSALFPMLAALTGQTSAMTSMGYPAGETAADGAHFAHVLHASHHIVETETQRLSGPDGGSRGADASDSGLPGPGDELTDSGPPKIFGPSEVHAEVGIESSNNEQTSVIIVTGDPAAQPDGATNVGSDTVGHLIEQVKDAGGASGYGFWHNLNVDYHLGDLTTLNTLQQMNTLYEDDRSVNIVQTYAPDGSLLGDVSISQSVTSGGNQSGNTAAMNGGLSLLDYDVLVVTGDLTEINKIVQVNLIVDSDINTVAANGDIETPYGSASSIWDAAINSGGNVEVNLAFIVDEDTGSVYLVGGSYATFFSVSQTNMLTDADINDIIQLFHSQEGTGFLGFDASGVISSGDNSQTNVAGLVGTDGATEELPPDCLSDLLLLLAFAGLHPGDGETNVLVVDGNYTIINLVVQINVIYDSDQNTLVVEADGAMGSLTDPNPPPVETGEELVEDDPNAVGDGSESVADDEGGETPDDASAASPDDPPSEMADDPENPSEENPEQPLADPPPDPASSPSAQSDLLPDEPMDASSPVESDAGGDTGEGSEEPDIVYVEEGHLNYDQVVDSGANEAHNTAILVDGPGPQLVIVQGHYYEYNFIEQINILVDSDHNLVRSAMNEDDLTGHVSDSSQDGTHLTAADDILNRMSG